LSMIASGLLPTSRRPNPCPRSSKPFLDMSHLPAGARRLQLALNCAAKQETRSSRTLFPKNTISRSVPFPAHFNAPDQWSRARRYWARVDHEVYFKLEPARTLVSVRNDGNAARGVRALIRRHDLRHHISDSFRAGFIPTSFYSVASKTLRIARVMPHVYFRLRITM
jgi:hypothetical protein